jgi:hypothetical protein
MRLMSTMIGAAERVPLLDLVVRTAKEADVRESRGGPIGTGNRSG